MQKYAIPLNMQNYIKKNSPLDSHMIHEDN